MYRTPDRHKRRNRRPPRAGRHRSHKHAIAHSGHPSSFRTPYKRASAARPIAGGRPRRDPYIVTRSRLVLCPESGARPSQRAEARGSGQARPRPVLAPSNTGRCWLVSVPSRVPDPAFPHRRPARWSTSPGKGNVPGVRRGERTGPTRARRRGGRAVRWRALDPMFIVPRCGTRHPPRRGDRPGPAPLSPRRGLCPERRLWPPSQLCRRLKWPHDSTASPCSARSKRPSSCTSADIAAAGTHRGTHGASISGLWRQPRPRNRAGFGFSRGCYGPAWIRTRDQRIMSPLL